MKNDRGSLHARSRERREGKTLTEPLTHGKKTQKKYLLKNKREELHLAGSKGGHHGLKRDEIKTRCSTDPGVEWAMWEGGGTTSSRKYLLGEKKRSG